MSLISNTSDTSEQGTATTDPGNGQAPGIMPYTGGSLGDVTEIMSFPELPSGIAVDMVVALLTVGARADVVFRDSRPDGFSVVNLRLAPHVILPAHHHDADCLYYVVSGWIMLGRRRIDAGGGFRVLAKQPYAYRAGSDGATVLEFRHTTSFNMVITENSEAKWREMADVASQNDNWPGFTESAALPPA
jgi:hypothetical protein